jgi:hypothetical protein
MARTDLHPTEKYGTEIERWLRPRNNAPTMLVLGPRLTYSISVNVGLTVSLPVVNTLSHFWEAHGSRALAIAHRRKSLNEIAGLETAMLRAGETDEDN